MATNDQTVYCWYINSHFLEYIAAALARIIITYSYMAQCTICAACTIIVQAKALEPSLTKQVCQESNSLDLIDV
jgi:S-methylmethionine-dependent homocysteine/selenocysteine methylase